MVGNDNPSYWNLINYYFIGECLTFQSTNEIAAIYNSNQTHEFQSIPMNVDILVFGNSIKCSVIIHVIIFCWIGGEKEHWMEEVLLFWFIGCKQRGMIQSNIDICPVEIVWCKTEYCFASFH